MDDQGEHTSEPAAPEATPEPASPEPASPQPASPQPASPAPQPAVGWASPDHAPVTKPRSRLAGVAGAILLLLGVLGALLGLLIAAAGGLMGGLGPGDIPGLSDVPGFASAVGGFIVIIGVVVIVYSLLYLFAGIGVVRGRGWGRAMGIIVAIISGLVWLAALASPNPQANTQSGVLLSAILFAAHLYVFAALTFRWRG